LLGEDCSVACDTAGSKGGKEKEGKIPRVVVSAQQIEKERGEKKERVEGERTEHNNRGQKRRKEKEGTVQ
jgi:hypothetical protein